MLMRKKNLNIIFYFFEFRMDLHGQAQTDMDKQRASTDMDKHRLTWSSTN